MKTRTITSCVIILLAVPLFWFSDTVVFPFVMAALAAVGTVEFLRVTGHLATLPITVPAVILSFAMPPFVYFMRTSFDGMSVTLFCLIALFAWLLYLFAVAVIKQGDIPFSGIGTVYCGTAYVTAAFAALEIIRLLEHGLYLLILVFLAAWTCDVFAYLCGRLFGKHPLIPRVSPKKTVEGSIGGTVFVVAAFVLYGFLLSRLTSDVNPNYLILTIAGLLLAVISQIGDLIASLIKREYGAKDYGNLFPGHGGVLDRFDSVLAVATVLMLLCLFVNPLV